MKTEHVQHRLFDKVIDAATHIVVNIEYYNREMPHSALDFQSPVRYEKLCA